MAEKRDNRKDARDEKKQQDNRDEARKNDAKNRKK